MVKGRTNPNMNMSNRTVQWLCYLLSIFILIFYISVAGLTLNPDVTPEYEQYYIENSVESWPGDDGLDYNLGERLYLGNDNDEPVDLSRRGSGWSGQESWGVWTDGKEAHLVFTIDDNAPGDLNLSLNATGFSPDKAQHVEVLANNKPVSSLAVSVDGFTTYNVILQESNLETNQNGESIVHVTFRIQNPTSPKQLGINDDGRQLGMGVRWVELELANQTALIPQRRDA